MRRSGDGIRRTDEQFKNALEDIARAVINGLIDDDECARRLAVIGATDEDLEEIIL